MRTPARTGTGGRVGRLRAVHVTASASTSRSTRNLMHHLLVVRPVGARTHGWRDGRWLGYRNTTRDLPRSVHRTAQSAAQRAACPPRSRHRSTTSVCGSLPGRWVVIVVGPVSRVDGACSCWSGPDSRVEPVVPRGRCPGARRWTPRRSSRRVHRQALASPQLLGVSSTVIHRSVHRCEHSSHACFTRSWTPESSDMSSSGVRVLSRTAVQTCSETFHGHGTAHVRDGAGVRGTPAEPADRPRDRLW